MSSSREVFFPNMSIVPLKNLRVPLATLIKGVLKKV